MQFLALLLALSLTSDVATEAGSPPLPARDPAAFDLCELGRQIARLEPCTDPKSCEALQIWKDFFGPPAPDFANPGESSRVRRGWATAAKPELRERSFSYRELMRTRHCWATAGGFGRLAKP